MQSQPDTPSTVRSVAPDFGAGVALRSEPCSARELFNALFADLEEHVHYLKPAFDFASAALSAASLPSFPREDPLDCLERTITWAQSSLAPLEPSELARAATRWPARVVQEFAPVGLSDGAWLRGAMLANHVETEVGMWLLKQYMLRFGDPGSREAYAQRYAALLRSVGVPPDAITRWEPDESAPCAELSYEHGLLGVTLGLFPSALGPETLGYNLWMTAVGPCPLLERLTPQLQAAGACLRYRDRLDRAELADLARQAVYQALLEDDDPACFERILRGFAAAHGSYERWERAVRGRNIPVTPGEFFEEALRHKARFGAPSAEERAALLASFPEAERKAIEQPGDDRARPTALPLAGRYTAPQDLASLTEAAYASFAPLSYRELYHRFVNADQFPMAHLFGQAFVTGVLARVSAALDSDERLHSSQPPPYSERVIAELVADQHRKNTRGRKPLHEALAARDEDDKPAEYIGAIFDGCWLQGFADVSRSSFEEYGWMFRIYASEHGDGDMTWNHSRIFRKEFAPLGPDVMLPKTDARLYDLFDVGVGSVAKLAIALNTRRFMPEILGMNLAIEASGVGGVYLDRWKRAEGRGLQWEALAARLHNSIDNYADGHTKWSLSAVQAFMRRVKDVAPDEVERQWHRVWRLWRLQDLLSFGSKSEQDALAEHLQLRSLAPT